MYYHQIRTKSGDFRLDDEEVSMEIHQNKLRIVWPKKMGETPDVPADDFPYGWGKSLDATHTDIIIPAEHKLNGKDFRRVLNLPQEQEHKRNTSSYNIN